MAVRPVLKMGEPLLRQVAAPVQRFDAELTALVADMNDTMRALHGAGLAAPQIGVSLRLVIFEVTSNPRYPDVAPIPYTVLVNPELTPLDDEQEEGWEGCLSVPGLRGLVPRFRRLRYQGRDIAGAQIDRTVEGFHARVVQHEVDHLDGVLYPQRMRDLSNFGFEDALIGRMTADAGLITSADAGVGTRIEAHRLGDAHARQLLQQRLRKLLMGGAIEQRLPPPSRTPRDDWSATWAARRITRNDVSVQRRLEVTEDGVVDALRCRHLEHRISQTRQVLQEERALVRAERVEAGDDGVGKKQRITAQELSLAEHRPTREQTRDDARLATRPGRGHLPVNRRFRRSFRIALHVSTRLPGREARQPSYRSCHARCPANRGGAPPRYFPHDRR